MNLIPFRLHTLMLLCLTGIFSAQGKLIIGLIDEHKTHEYRVEQLLDFTLQHKKSILCQKSQVRKLPKSEAEFYNQAGIQPIAMISHYLTNRLECIDLTNTSQPVEIILNSENAILGVYSNKMYYTNPETNAIDARKAYIERGPVAIIPSQD